MDYVNVCGCMADQERLREVRETEKEALCFPPSLPTFLFPPHLSSFCRLHLSLKSLLRALHLTVCLLFFFVFAGKYRCLTNPGGARVMKRKEDNIYIWIVPPHGHNPVSASHDAVLNTVQPDGPSSPPARHLYCYLALLRKAKFTNHPRAFRPILPWPLTPPPPSPHTLCHGQRQQLPWHVGGLWLGRNFPVPTFHRRCDFLDSRVQCHHSNWVARERRSGVHHCPATGAAQRHQHPDCQPVMFGHPHVCGVSPCYCHIHTDGPLGARRGFV